MNNLEPVTKRDHLEPRAKIGDVVIVKLTNEPNEDGEEVEDDIIQLTIEAAQYISGKDAWGYIVDTPSFVKIPYNYLKDKDILKNLTTNISYE